MLSSCLLALFGALAPLAYAQFPIPIRDVTDEEVVKMNGAGPVLFQFGQTSTYAKQKFTYTATTDSLPYVADCYCAGDNLAIFVNGQLWGWTNGGSPDIGSTQCAIYQPSLQNCFWRGIFNEDDDEDYPRYTYYSGDEEDYALPPGDYTIEIFSLSSPFGQGYALLTIFTPNGILDFIDFGGKAGFKNFAKNATTWEEAKKMITL